MKKRKIPIVLIIGIVLVALSFLIIAGIQIHNHIGTNELQTTLTKMEQLISNRCDGTPGAYPNVNMPVLQIDGKDYVALLEIPSMKVALPIADKWNESELAYSPARFSGSAYDNTLVIGGTDNSHQFDFCDEIELGTQVTVTDMTGARFKYKVVSVDRSSSAKGTWLADSKYHLTFYCRSTYSMEYIAVRCNFVYS